MSTSSWSALLGSAVAVLVSTSGLPPQPPADSSQGASTPEVTQTTIAWWQAAPPAGGRFGGRRGDGVLAIAPSEVAGMNLIWHDLPLLIWKGEAGQIELNDEESGELIWRQAVSKADRLAAYSGAALQPGQSYEWSLRDQVGGLSDLVTFQVMAAEEREQIAVELAARAVSLKAEGATAEEIALQRANYFAERQLWADVLQEAFAVESPSAELAELLQTVLLDIS